MRSSNAGTAETIRERRIAVGDYRTRILDVPGGGPLTLLLHGFADSADTWRPLLGELGRRGRRAVAIDLPGFGEADGVGRSDLLGEYDRFLATALRELRMDAEPAVIVVGNSMGATIALRAAQHRPSDCRSGDPSGGVGAVVALAPAGLGFTPVLHTMSGALDLLLPALRIVYRVPWPGPVVRTIIAAYYRARLAPGLDNARRFGSHFDGMRDFRRIGVLGRRLMDEVRDGCLDLAAMSGPVTLVWGSDDPICDIGGAQTLIDAVPDSRLVVVPGSGHLPQIEAPAAVADVIDVEAERVSGR